MPRTLRHRVLAVIFAVLAAGFPALLHAETAAQTGATAQAPDHVHWGSPS